MLKKHDIFSVLLFHTISLLAMASAPCALAMESKSCEDPVHHLCIHVKADDSVTALTNVGVVWSRDSENPLWNEEGNYNSFIGPNHSFWSVSPVSYFQSHRFKRIRYLVNRVGSVALKPCGYRIDNPKPVRYEIMIHQDSRGHYSCQLTSEP